MMLSIRSIILAGVITFRAAAAESATDAQIAKTSSMVAAKPQSAVAWSRHGDALMQKGRETGDASYANLAESAYRKTLAISPKSVDALVGLAWASGVRHEFESSIEWAKKALAFDTKNSAAYGLIGDAAVELGDYERAFDEYQKMLDISPDLSSYGRSAHLLYITGDNKRASLLMWKAIQAGSPYAENTAWCRAQLALIQFSQGAYVPAAALLEEGLRLSPNDHRLLAAMGKVTAAGKKYAQAIEYYKKALLVTPDQETIAALGDLYTLTGKKDEAAKQYDLVEVIAKVNRANGVLGDLSTARFYADHDRKIAEGLKLAEHEYRTRPNVFAADTLAWSHFKNGNIAEAKRFITYALRKGTSEASFQYHKGMIDAADGHPSEAKLALYSAMSINPGFDPIQSSIAIKTLAGLGGSVAAQAGVQPGSSSVRTSSK